MPTSFDYNMDEERQLKYQLAQFAYDIFSHAFARYTANKEVLVNSYEDLTSAQKFAWEQCSWALKDLIRTKRGVLDTINKKNDDVGYMLYSGVKSVMKNHTGIVTYSKFKEEVKNDYRELAARIRTKLENDEIGWVEEEDNET